MFPLRDDNPTLRTSFTTFAIIAANAAAWILVQGAGRGPDLAGSVCHYGAIPGELLGRLEEGMAVPLGHNLVCVIDSTPNWYTVLTSMFMHGGWLHLLGNMWFLYIFGDNVEEAMGHVRFLVFYLLCGVAAVAAQMTAHPESALPMVGASGAIGGVMGAYAVLYPRAPVHMLIFLGFFITRVVVPAFFMLGYWFLLQLLAGMGSLGSTSGGVAFWAHTGGFLAGIALLKVFCVSGRLQNCRSRRGRMEGMLRRT